MASYWDKVPISSTLDCLVRISWSSFDHNIPFSYTTLKITRPASFTFRYNSSLRCSSYLVPSHLDQWYGCSNFAVLAFLLLDIHALDPRYCRCFWLSDWGVGKGVEKRVLNLSWPLSCIIANNDHVIRNRVVSLHCSGGLAIFFQQSVLKKNEGLDPSPMSTYYCPMASPSSA